MVTIILSSGKCSWGKCVFCGWGKLSSNPSENEVKRDFLRKLVNTKDKDIKIFSSGSFLDNAQFSPEVRKWMIDKLKENGVVNLTIESRTEFVTYENLKDFEGLNLTIAIGLEIADDEILMRLNKGMALKNFEKAAEVIHDSGAKLRVYILVNPPFVNNPKEAFQKTHTYAKRFADSIIALNCYPHSKSELFDLWVKGEWKPLDETQFNEVLGSVEIEKDFSNYSFVPKFPPEKRELIQEVSLKNLEHPHYNVWQDYLVRFYKKSKDKEYALFLPCSFKKPYRTSSTHRAILSRLIGLKEYKKIHQLMLSSPGIIPREFENEYPFSSYEWNEKDEDENIKKEYTRVIKNRIVNYLKKHNYTFIFSYLKPSSESFEALSLACSELGLELNNLVDEDLFRSLDETKPRILTEPPLLDSMVKKIKETIS